MMLDYLDDQTWEFRRSSVRSVSRDLGISFQNTATIIYIIYKLIRFKLFSSLDSLPRMLRNMHVYESCFVDYDMNEVGWCYNN